MGTAFKKGRKMKNSPSCAHVLQKTFFWSFHVVVLQRTAKKCTKTYNARAERLFLLIKPIVLWRSRCRRRRRCKSSLMQNNAALLYQRLKNKYTLLPHKKSSWIKHSFRVIITFDVINFKYRILKILIRTRATTDCKEATFCPNELIAVKALLHYAIFLTATYFAMLLGHKLHESLPSVTCPEMKMPRNISVAATVAKSRSRFYFVQR